MSTVSYKDAGVDIDAGNQFVENIKPHVKSTMIPGVLGGIGSFAGAFELFTNSVVMWAYFVSNEYL